MLGLAAALLLVAAAQAPASDDPSARAAPGAALAFGQVCLLRLNVKQTAAAYAAGSEEIGRGVLADTPALKGLLVIDGAAGRGCRVAYTGDQAEAAWRGFSALYASATQGAQASCTPGASSSADRLIARCVSTAPAGDPTLQTRHAELTVTRSGQGGLATVEATFTQLQP